MSPFLALKYRHSERKSELEASGERIQAIQLFLKTRKMVPQINPPVFWMIEIKFWNSLVCGYKYNEIYQVHVHYK